MELCAYHEAAHAVIAIVHGATVESLSVDVDQDDEPRRDGEVEVHWPQRMDRRTVESLSIDVTLAGPIAEIIYEEGTHFRGPIRLHDVPEWSGDWATALRLATLLEKQGDSAAQIIARRLNFVHQLICRDEVWQAIAALADEAMAHEQLCRDEITETVARWLG